MSLAGPCHEKEIEFLKRVITYNIDGWTWTGDSTHSKKHVNELNLGGAKSAVTLGSKATGVNDPHREDNLTAERELRSTRHMLEGCSITLWTIHVCISKMVL